MPAIFPMPDDDQARCNADAISHAEAFLISDIGAAVGEASTAAIAQLLTTAARKAGFRPSMSVIEIAGTCSHCGRD